MAGMRPLGDRTFIVAALVLLGVLAVAAFTPVLGNGFVWVDYQYILENPKVRPGLTSSGFAWSLTSFWAGNWHPLTWISHMMDVSLFGLQPLGHHAINLMLHAVDAALLFLVLRLYTGASWPAFWAAALWSIHPSRVEVVAWIAERKELLAVFFILLSLMAYLSYVKRGGTSSYTAVIVCFSLALASKPMAVTLPFLLLVLDWWPLHRLSRRNWPKRFAEKLPLILPAAAVAVITLLAQREGMKITFFPFSSRLTNALVSYVTYILQTFRPVGLLPFYPHPGNTLPLFSAAFSFLALALATFAFWTARRRHGYLLAGWLWFLGTMVPVIGLVHVGFQAMADRYTYLPSIGLVVMAVWGIFELTSGRTAVQRASACLGVAILLTSAGLARGQTRMWKDEVTLWGKVVARHPDSALTRNNLGVALGDQGRHREAVEQFRAALRLSPNDAEIRHNYIAALRLSGMTEPEGAGAREGPDPTAGNPSP